MHASFFVDWLENAWSRVPELVFPECVYNKERKACTLSVVLCWHCTPAVQKCVCQNLTRMSMNRETPNRALHTDAPPQIWSPSSPSSNPSQPPVQKSTKQLHENPTQRNPPTIQPPLARGQRNPSPQNYEHSSVRNHPNPNSACSNRPKAQSPRTVAWLLWAMSKSSGALARAR